MSELIRAAGLSGYEELATELGLDAARLARRAGLSLAALRDPDALISYRALMHLLEQSARAAQRPDFGLRLSQRQGLAILGPIAVAMENASTVVEALQLGSQYVFVHSPAIRFAVKPVKGSGGFTDLCFSIEMPHPPTQTQTLELSLGVVVQIVMHLGQGRIRPQAVLFPHAPASTLDVYAQCIACPCRFEQDCAAVRVSTTALLQPLEARNPVLRDLARNYLDSRHARPQHTLTERVATLIREFLGTQRTSREDIARMLVMHPRTLQRRLREEGAVFEAIKDQVRREVLDKLLQRSSSPSLTQIAAMLDYSEQSTLSRSCRRWYGVSPSNLLKTARLER